MGLIQKTSVVPTAIAVVGLAASILLSLWLEGRRPQLPEGYSDTDLTVLGSRLRGFSFGAEGLLADWYYMRGLQYIGAKMLASRDKRVNLDDLTSLNPRLLFPMLDNATDLDPGFIGAYSYGAVVLPAIDPHEAVTLLMKGIRNNPSRWELYRDLGYIYWKLGEYDKAAETYESGSYLETAPPYMKLMAAAMKTESGSRETARQIYRQMYESDDPMVRLTAQRRLDQIEALDEMEAIDGALSYWIERSGLCPDTLRDILPILSSPQFSKGRNFRMDIANNVVDPSGAPYLIDPETCNVKLDGTRTTLPLR